MMHRLFRPPHSTDRLEQLQAEVARLDAAAGTAATKAAAAEFRVAEVEIENAMLRERLELADAKAAEVDRLRAAATVTDEKVSLAASRLLASHGHPAVALDSQSEPRDIIAELARRTGGERTKFFNDNRAAIMRAMRKEKP